MSRIFISFFNAVQHPDDPHAMPCFYESFIKELAERGNELLVMHHHVFSQDFGPLPESIKAKITEFSPDFAVIFNNAFYDLSEHFDFPVYIYEVDSVLYYSNKDVLLAKKDRFRYIVPQTARLVRLIHDAGRPALQHSCGNVFDCGLIEDVIDVCRFDGRHSYEDKILPVETAYDRYHHRLAILGGLDVDFLCRGTPEQVAQRARAMLERCEADGAYALGSGNSIPDYVPKENYFAMISAIHR